MNDKFNNNQSNIYPENSSLTLSSLCAEYDKRLLPQLGLVLAGSPLLGTQSGLINAV